MPSGRACSSQRTERSSSRWCSCRIRDCTKASTVPSSASTAAARSGSPNTRVATTKARTTSAGSHPVSSAARNANVRPPVPTTWFTSTVVAISRRSGWSARWSPKRSPSSVGKYPRNVCATHSSSGSELASTSRPRLIFACAMTTDSSGIVSPTRSRARRSSSDADGSASRRRSTSPLRCRASRNRRCAGSNPAENAPSTERTTFCS